MSSLSMYDPATWEQVRDDYLCGMTAAEVCRRHGVSRSQVYAQARAGGWRRADQAVAAAPLDDDAPARPTHEMAGDALRRAGAALALGRLGEARGWTQLAVQLRALAVQELSTEDWSRVLRRHAAEAGLPDPAGRGSPADPAPQPVAAQDFDGGGPDSPASPAAARSPADGLSSAPPAEGPADAGNAAELAAWRAYCARMRQACPAEPLWSDLEAALAASADVIDTLGPLGPLDLGRPPDTTPA